MKTFTVARADGRSAAQVVLDYVKGGEPGRLYTYDELAEALAVGARPYSRVEVQKTAQRLVTRLLREQQRRLHVVQGAGYRLAPASDHMSLAHTDRRRADTQLTRGLNTLRHVRFDEMDSNTRRAHEGHLMVAEALYANQVALDRRLRTVEELVTASMKAKSKEVR